MSDEDTHTQLELAAAWEQGYNSGRLDNKATPNPYEPEMDWTKTIEPAGMVVMVGAEFDDDTYVFIARDFHDPNEKWHVRDHEGSTIARPWASWMQEWQPYKLRRLHFYEHRLSLP